MSEQQDTDKAPVDDPIAVAILETLASGHTPTFQDMARRIAEARRKPKDRPNLWRRYLVSVRQQAVHLAKIGSIEIIRKGQAVDPRDFKGIVKMRLPQNHPGS